MIDILNPMEDGTCRTIKSQYAQTSTPNLATQGTFGASGGIEFEKLDNALEILDQNEINNKFLKFIYKIDEEFWLIRIRKLTPKECWRLMGFYDEDFEKAEKVNSNTQLYKQAGNSIVVNVLEEIFKQMIGE